MDLNMNELKKSDLRFNYGQYDGQKSDRRSAEGNKFSGHTHLGTDINALTASDGDYAVLDAFGMDQSVIYNSLGKYQTFSL